MYICFNNNKKQYYDNYTSNTKIKRASINYE